MKFKEIGFFIEYHCNGKFVGTTLCDTNNREVIGYYSKLEHFAEEDILLLNNKKIKKGTKYHTYIYPLCGKKTS
jgi:hypothetical protein